MLSKEDVEEMVPSPIKINITCNDDDLCDFDENYQNPFDKLKKSFNKKHDTKIEDIIVEYFCFGDEDFDEESEYKNENSYVISVGKETVYVMEPSDDSRSQSFYDFYMSCKSVTEKIMNTWHDKIIEIQEDNNKKLEMYKMEEYDELLYSYYRMRGNEQAFIYLKKLAFRYPNSIYMKNLRRIYSIGKCGWHKKNKDLCVKLINKNSSNKNF